MKGEEIICSFCGYPKRIGAHSLSCQGTQGLSEESAEPSKERELSQMERAREILNPKDYQQLVFILGNEEGDLSEIFDPKNTLMHTTGSDVFENMLTSGSILTEGKSQKTPGASFTDGNFPEAVSFQLLYDNIAGGGEEKLLQSERYDQALGGDLPQTFIGYFWEHHNAMARTNLKELARKIPREDQERLGIDPNAEVTSLEQALKIGTYFKPPRQEGFGVTIVYDQTKSEALDVSQATTSGLQSLFEKRSFRKGGVPLSEASVILVPRARIDEVAGKLRDRGLAHVTVRASEEMEARRIMEHLN